MPGPFPQYSNDDITITTGDGSGHLQDIVVPNACFLNWFFAEQQDATYFVNLLSSLQNSWGFICAPYLMPVNTSGSATGNASIGMV